jgi:hypothetical protein
MEYDIQLPADVKKISSKKGIKYGNTAFENEYLDDDNNEISSDIQLIFAKNDMTYLLDCYTLPKDLAGAESDYAIIISSLKIG